MGIPFSLSIAGYYDAFQKEISESFLSSHVDSRNEACGLMETSCELMGRRRKGTPHKAYVGPPKNWESVVFFLPVLSGGGGKNQEKIGGCKAETPTG